LPKGDHPEMDVSDFLDVHGINTSDLLG
jgi:hypothetical protein